MFDCSAGWLAQLFASAGRTASSNYDGSQYGARMGLGYKFNLGHKISFIPMASIDYTYLEQDAYSETGAGAIGLNVQGQNYDRTRYGLGGRLTSEFGSRNTKLRPEIDLNWYHDTGTLNKDVVASYIGGGSSFITPGTNSIGRDFVNLGLGLTMQTTRTTSIQIRYDLDASSGFTSHTGGITGRILF